MFKKKYSIVLIISGVFVGLVLAKWLKIEVFQFNLESAITLTIIIIGLIVINFVITSGKNNKKDSPHALGLPIGSVRATLALTMAILFVLVAMFFYLDSDDLTNKKELAESILTILGTLVIAISSFYFGVKATEQGSKIAQNAFRDANIEQKADIQISPLIIQEAITNNKENWIKEFNCIDVKLGKKVSGKTRFELNCIVFVVEVKLL
ncbi:MAG: hypothetical protein AAFQ20_12160, partial [Bacteroidota bacterium]